MAKKLFLQINEVENGYLLSTSAYNDYRREHEYVALNIDGLAAMVAALAAAAKTVEEKPCKCQ